MKGHENTAVSGRPRKGAHRPLTREKIVKTALRIVDREGLAALSMRRLGASLGVDPMAVYYHVPGKTALYDAIVEAIMGEIVISVDGGGSSPLDRLKTSARAYKDALLAHPNALPVVASRPIRTRASLRPIEWMLSILIEQGLPLQIAVAAVNTCGYYILGSVQSYIPHLTGMPIHEHEELTMENLSPEEFPNLHKVLAVSTKEHPFETEFEIGLDALLRGFLLSRPAE